MNPRALMLPAVPLVLAGLGWWASGSLTAKMVKPQPTPNVPQITLPSGIEALVPAGPRPPLGYLELSAFGFTEPPKPVLAKAVKPRVPTAGDLYVVDSVLRGSQFVTATIGDRTVKVGDKLDAKYTVLAIQADGVVVQGSGKKDRPEKIGFRPYVAAAEEVASSSSGAAAGRPASAASAPGQQTPPGMRDFRQILETLKL